MSTQIQSTSSHEQQNPSVDTVIGFAVLGCLVAGGVGIWKAFGMTSGIDVLLCLVGAAASFGTVLYVCFCRD